MLHALHRRWTRSKPARLALVSMIVSFGLASVDTISSIFLNSIVHNPSTVGFVIALLAFLQVLFFLFTSPFLERWPETKTWLFSAFVLVIGYVIFSRVSSLAGFIAVAIPVLFANVLRHESYGILVRDSAGAKRIGEVEGLVYAVDNIGWVAGPLLAGALATAFGFPSVFLATAAFMMVGFFYFLGLRLRDKNHHTRDDATLKGALVNMKEYFLKRRQLLLYALRGGIGFYWGAIFTYLPLFILSEGLSEMWVGVFLFGVSVPLVIFEYRIGKMADSSGYRQFFLAGFAILSSMSLLAFFASSVYWVLALFVLASLGAACLEGTTDAYFFRITRRADEERYYGPYQTSTTAFSFLAKLIGAALLLFLPYKFVFLMIAIMMLSLFLLATRLPRRTAYA